MAFLPARPAPFPWGGCILLLALLVITGCGRKPGEPELVWGKRGTQGGDMVKPRAAAIDAQDRLYIVDFTARIQVYDRDGKYLRGWTTPDCRNGRPSGLSMDPKGNLVVSDSHYNCVRVYTPEGTELQVFGGEAGSAPGQFSYLSDAVQDKKGYYYVAEFGQNQRISKMNDKGKVVATWGCEGREPGQFSRIRALALGPDDNLYVADACNHRIQVFTRDGELVRIWGTPGSEPGQLSYPYDLAFGKNGELFVAEFGNHRVQKFTPEGESLGTWGSPGREPGKLFSPWALVVDSRGQVHVIDSENHRVQRLPLEW